MIIYLICEIINGEFRTVQKFYHQDEALAALDYGQVLIEGFEK